MPRFVFARSYDDFDELAADARSFDLDLVPTSKGVFSGAFVLSEVGPVQLVRARFERELIQRGSTPPGHRTFVVPAPGLQRLRWRGHVVGPDDLMVFPSNRELSSRSGPDFHVFVIAVHEAHLAAAAHSLGLPDPAALLGAHEVFRLHPGGLDALRAGLLTYFENIGGAGGAGDSFACDVLPQILLRAIAVATTLSRPISPTRHELVRQAEASLDQPAPPRPWSVQALAAVLGTSERTLHRAFVEQYGDGPKAVMAARRLNRVRRVLHGADPVRGVISRVANEAGFWHMGKFADDYRRQFGELPSETLARNSEP